VPRSEEDRGAEELLVARSIVIQFTVRKYVGRAPPPGALPTVPSPHSVLSFGVSYLRPSLSDFCVNGESRMLALLATRGVRPRIIRSYVHD